MMQSIKDQIDILLMLIFVTALIWVTGSCENERVTKTKIGTGNQYEPQKEIKYGKPN